MQRTLLFVIKLLTLLSLGSSNAIMDHIDVIDMTNPTTWQSMLSYYGTLENELKICTKCGASALGTVMHLEFSKSTGSMQPAVIPAEYFISRMIIIDVSQRRALNPSLILTIDMVQHYEMLKHDTWEPTLLLFHFGWSQDDIKQMKTANCICKVPGLSYELAEWIATNMTHVVGVATDAPTLESEETTEFSHRTVSNVFGTNGIYMIENVLLTRNIQERGCMAIATPLKLLNSMYVPARLVAFCPGGNKKQLMDVNVVLALRNAQNSAALPSRRLYDVNLEEILN